MMKTFLDPGFTEVINLPDAYSPMLSEYATWTQKAMSSLTFQWKLGT
jgi:hypothetical protein